MTHITKRQHYVPDFYLRQWSNGAGHITCHDLHNAKTFPCNPANALAQSYFYEEDASQPDNRIENVLSAMETTCSATFRDPFGRNTAGPS